MLCRVNIKFRFEIFLDSEDCAEDCEDWYTDNTYKFKSRKIKPKQWYTIVLTQTFDEESNEVYICFN